MNLHATKVANKVDSDAGAPGSPAVSASSPPGRFTYASGAKPLQGYTLKRGIGHGGFGEVYYATSDAGKEVALKLIRRNWDVELRGVNHCLNLKHPNLLALYDVRQDANDDHWVVMELMSGESLEDVLQRQPNGLPAEEALAWMHGIAAGVAYLHDHGIVHRDLKPGNIFVDEGIVKIGDYGLSKFMSCSRRSGQTGSVGTVHYMAPEVANGRYGKEIDIYALGIILYEMLTGHVPFEGESVGEILMKHLTAEPDVSKLAEPYRAIVARTLAKDPAKRFASVEEMIAMLPPAPKGAALTASARFVGPNAVVAQRSAFAGAGAAAVGAANPTGFSFWPPDANLKGENLPQGQPAAHAALPPPIVEVLPDVPPPLPTPVAEEPVLRWINQTKSELTAWWERMNFQPWQKLLILFGVCFAGFNLMPLWLPTLFIATVGYVIYRVARGAIHSAPRLLPKAVKIYFVLAAVSILIASATATFVNHEIWDETAFLAVIYVATALLFLWVYRKNGSRLSNTAMAPSEPATRNVAPPIQNQLTRMHESRTRWRWRQHSTMAHYQPGTPRERVAQLLESMLMSAAVVAVMSLVMGLLKGAELRPGQYAWLATTSLAGTWGILLTAKLWEGRHVDNAMRRFVLLVAGLAVGALSYGVFQWLWVGLPYDHNMTFASRASRDMQGTFFGADGSPTLTAYLAFFGFVFAVVRWWKLADPTRHTRLSLWAVAVAVFWSFVVNLFWPFPQPWGMMTAATIAVAVQMASPCLTKSQRSANRASEG